MNQRNILNEVVINFGKIIVNILLMFVSQILVLVIPLPYSIFVISLFLYVVWEINKKMYPEMFKNAISLKTFIVVLLVAYICMMVISYGINYIRNLLFPQLINTETVNQSQLVDSLKSKWLPMAYLAIVVAPIVEELVFRLSVFKLAINKYLAFILSSVLFTVAHSVISLNMGIMYFLADSLVYLPMSLVLGFIYFKYRNIYLNIGLHILNNLISIIVISIL